MHTTSYSLLLILTTLNNLLAVTSETIAVTTLTDEDDGNLEVSNGDGISLREALNHSSNDSSITFDPSLNGGIITLTEGQLTITRNLSIDASALSRGITIDANGAVTNHRVIEIQPNTVVTCSGLNLTGGSAELGGAILANGTGTGNSVQLILNACTLSNNTGDFGGGIFSNGQSGNVDLTLNSCTIANNNIVFDGGGIFSDGGFGGSATLTLNSCTFSNNSANNGGGIFNIGDSGDAVLILNNSILAGNTATGSGPDLWDSNPDSTTTIIGTNIISSLEGQDSLSMGTLNLIIAAPLLAPLGNHGGPTATMPPLPGSPAINAAGINNPGGTDQRGLLRLVGGNLDVGAVEIQNGETVSPFPNPFPFPVSEFASDSDLDSIPNGLEVILGTNPFIPDHTNSRNPAFSFNSEGNPSLIFGRNNELPAGITLTVERSTTLTNNSFETIGSYDSTSNSVTLPGSLSSNLFTFTDEEFVFIDTSILSPRAFYRLGAAFNPN